MFASLFVAGTTYLGYVAKVLGVKYYVSQQISQMQAHYLNKDRIVLAASRFDNKTRALVINIFKDYERDILSNDWCWIKTAEGMHCVQKKDYDVCEKERFDGIFPPIASIEHTIKKCSKRIDTKWKTTWENKVNIWAKGYGKGFVSNLEFYVLQLEALEKDITLVKVSKLSF